MSRRHLTFTRTLLGALVVAAALIAGFSSTALAVDNGDWAGTNCYPAGGCFYYNSPPGALLLSSTRRDSNFSDDRYSGGTVLEDHVRRATNTFGSKTLRLFQARDYFIGVNAGSYCVQPGATTGLLPFNVGTGLSSFLGPC